MVRKREKISDETIQLYLMGELAGPLFDRIRSIDEAPDLTILSPADSVIRETITKLRSVDQMLQEAADTSFEMPPDLSAKIETALAADNTKLEQRSRTVLTSIKGIFNWSNFWSMASGSALASLGFLALIYSQPESVEPVYHGLLADSPMTEFAEAEPELLASRRGVFKSLNPMRNNETDVVIELETELATLLEEHSRVLEELREAKLHEKLYELKKEDGLKTFAGSQNSSAVKDANFIVTEELAFRVVVSDQFGAFAVLENKSEVFLDESFHVDLLPLQNIDLSILYRASDGVTTTLVSDEKLTVGKPYSFPADLNGEATWQFAEQEGIDSLVFRTSDGSVHEIHFAVKE